MSITWQERMAERIDGKEEHVPWFLEDKLQCYEFLSKHGFTTPELLRTFEDPSQIYLENLPIEFVIKPTRESSMRGVLLLERQRQYFVDRLRQKEMTFQQIVEYEETLFKSAALPGNRIIVESMVCDVSESPIPRDFKAYAFRGEIGLVLEIDRNISPPKVSFFDGSFRPLDAHRIAVNPRYVTRGGAEAPVEATTLLDYASEVSNTLPTAFARVDMYSTPIGPCVGEITLTPGGFFYGLHFRLANREQLRLGALWSAAIQRLR